MSVDLRRHGRAEALAEWDQAFRLRQVSLCPRCGFEQIKGGCFCGGCGLNLEQSSEWQMESEWFVRLEPWKQNEIKRCWQASGKQKTGGKA